MKTMKNLVFLAVFSSFGIIFAFIACDNGTVEDSFYDPTQTFTVNFESNGGSPAPSQQTITRGGKITKPDFMIKEGYGFGGWYKEASHTNEWDFNTDIVTNNTTLYAKWSVPILVTGSNFNDKLRWLQTNSQNGGYYIVEIDSNLSVDPITFSYSGKNNISISLKGVGITSVVINFIYRVGASYIGSTMFTIGSGVTLILDDKLELKGDNYNNYLIRINSGGNLIINQGVKITGNYDYNVNSGCLYVGGNGTITLNGGEILGNNLSYGSRGVYVDGNAVFTINDGKISGNKRGGVYVVNNGTVKMSGGEISNNINNSEGTYNGGGGVNISNNGVFTMSGGKIFGNTAQGSNYNNGGGMFVGSNGTFTMSGGEIYGNTTSSYYFGYGGGVFFSGNVFTKTGGIIYGYTSGDSNSNAVKVSSGAVGSNRGHAIYISHSNTIYQMGKDSISGSGDNLSFNRTVTPPSWSGIWDF